MNPKTILLVEDDKPLRDFLTWSLRKRDCIVVTAESAEEAENLVPEADLLLLNLSLPKMSGEEFLRTVRAKGDYIPTVIVSGVADEAVRERVKKLKIVDFLSKPFSLDEFFKKVDKAVEVSEEIENIKECDTRLKGFIERQGFRLLDK
jgi:DNA-binding response OmpR family regulator